MKEIKIGVVGYSNQKFDKVKAIDIITEAYNTIDNQFAGNSKTVISGLTDLGIPALAYREAVSINWRTEGVACSKAEDYDCFPVDKKMIVGKEWGEESKTFLKSLDILVRIGGGKQSIREADEFKKKRRPVFEYDLPSKQ